MGQSSKRALVSGLEMERSTEDAAVLKRGLDNQQNLLSRIVQEFGEAISMSIALEVLQTGCSYEDAAVKFAQKCDQFQIEQFIHKAQKNYEDAHTSDA